MAQAALTAWFRTVDRETLKHALNNPDDIIAWAKEQIRDRQRSEEELIPLTALPPGAAHLAAALRYQERQIAKGLCAVCPQPLANNSVHYCERHLTIARLRHKPKNAKGELPGSVARLYSNDEQFESSHGRQPGTMKALALAREKQAKKLKGRATRCYSNRLTLRGGLGCSALALPDGSLRDSGRTQRATVRAARIGQVKGVRLLACGGALWLTGHHSDY
jgi:hypothetical protein